MDETDYVHIMPDDGGRMQQAGNHSGTGRAGEGLFRPPEPPELGSPGESPYCETSPETTVDGYVHLLHERTLQRRFRADASISRIKEWHAAIEKYIPNDTGEDMKISDRPAPWGNHGEYRILMDGPNNFFRVKAGVVDGL